MRSAIHRQGPPAPLPPDWQAEHERRIEQHRRRIEAEIQQLSGAEPGRTWADVYRPLITDEEVAEVRRLLASGFSGQEVSRRVGISADTVSRIKRGKFRQQRTSE